MVNDSPAAILFDTEGHELALEDGYLLTADSRGLLAMGMDDVGAARVLATDLDGYLHTDSPSTLAVLEEISAKPVLNGTLDAFGRQRVSFPFLLFNSKSPFDDQPLFFITDTATGGTATYVAAKSAVELTTTTSSGSRATRQTKRYFNYQPGKSFQLFITFNMVASSTNVHKRVGYFDNSNGLFLRLVGSSLSFVIRSDVTGSPIDAVVAQSSWNMDPMDGTGPSGIVLDITKVQILIIDFEWLGAGTARMGFVIGGELIYAHLFHAANILTTVWMRMPNLPVRWEIENVGAASGTPRLDAICCSVNSEGTDALVGIIRSANRGLSGISIGGDLVPIIAIRLKSAYNRATVFPTKSSIITSTDTDFWWQAVLNPTITGGNAASWTSVPNSAVEYDISRTGTVSGGIVVASGYAPDSLDLADISLSSLLTLASDFTGTSDEFVMAASRTGGGTDTFFGALTWTEVL